MNRLVRAAVFALICVAPAAPAAAQSLNDRVERAPDGRIRFSFPAREDVCGDGRNIQFRHRGNSDWMPTCDSGPAMVVLRKQDGAIVDIDTYVGGRWRDVDRNVTDLGGVTAGQAADFLLHVAETEEGGAGRDAIVPAMIADTVRVWRRLGAIARNEDRPKRTREQAMHWMAIEASARLDDDDESDDPNSEARERAVFALSQLPDDQAVPRLIDIARNHRFNHVRQRALFWLGQSGDARAIDVLEEVLER